MKTWFGSLGHLAVVLLVVSAATFGFVDWLPGDTASAILGERATPEALAEVRQELRLDDPLPLRYLRWLGNAARGDLGRSYRSGEAVLPVIMSRLPVSVELMLLAQLAALVFAVPLALYSAHQAGRPVDRLVSSVAFALMSVPAYAYALVLILVFAVTLKWLPATGYVPFSEAPLANLRSLLLPAATLALAEMPLYLRVLRTELVDTLQQPFVRTARAAGMSETRVLLKYALRPSSRTLVTMIGLNAAHLIGGAVLIERIFAIPGVGRLLVDAVFARDTVLVQGAVLIVAVGYVLINLGVDATQRMLDPRLRHAGHVS